ncbi:oxidoreductase [Altererythrobacter sp. B11]|uniref:Gfo/Idh/MocA family protein n=1 Tax=Altererythrobacter sp. B11 TaxID=2060312 RepID=UPI000DC723EA|nr:Gfo/Idh/MocA family oxidoreductase [Altererythrobacter sp. B11]BBC72818.1 oxidoreductase [Altererythrobacter sp. B11]
MSKPRIGFLGTGWIGRHRMEAILRGGTVEAAAICDPSPECLDAAAELAPAAGRYATLDAMLDQRLDGVVIATPSAHHAEQAIAALDCGVAVFCQKPLGRDEAEARAVVEAARRADRLLGVDLSYRHTAATAAIEPLLREGALGRVFAVDLTFHNAYGPDKPWFYDRAQSGGGCVIDLGVHLVDLALWLLGFPEVEQVSSRLYAKGQPLAPGAEQVEDYATARLDLAGGASVRLACSWHLHAGRDAVIEADFFGSDGAASIRNVGGSFYDFEASLHRGTGSEVLASPPDEWGGRAAESWARQLAAGARFTGEAQELTAVSAVLDRIYAPD